MNILLITPPFPKDGMSLAMRSPPLGLMLIAGAVKDLGHHIEIVDQNVVDLSDDELAARMKGFDMVGLSMMTNQYPQSMHILKIAKEVGATTVVGGFHPSLCPELVEEPEVDMVVRGEGEITFRELIEGVKPRAEILGLSYKENGAVHHNPERPLLKDLDECPMPDTSLIDADDYFYVYLPAAVIEASRGCPFACDFCCVQSVYHRKYREKTPERVIEEIKQVDKGARVIFFVDDNFTMNMKRVDRICDLMKSELDREFIIACQSRIDTIVRHPETIKKMTEVGFRVFFLGIESIHQKALDKMGKQIKTEQINKALDILNEIGILSYGSFIIGNVGETYDDLLKTIEFIRKSHFTFIQAGAIVPFPATPLYHQALEEGWLPKEDEQWWKNGYAYDQALMSTPDLTRDQITELTQLTMKRFYYNWSRYLKPRGWAKVLSKNYKWWRDLAPTVIFNGVKDFLLKF